MTETPLLDVSVLVTRPERQADDLVAAIESRGGVAIRFPVIETQPRESVNVAAAAEELRNPDIAIFVSANAVRYGLPFAGAASLAVVGPATARAVEEGGREVDIRSPGGFDSEHLLETPELQDVAGKVVRIIRGNGGRELLADTLRERGALVDYLEVYQRLVPDYDDSGLASICEQWRTSRTAVVTVMSVETLTNLVELLPAEGLELLGKTRLVTPASRVIKEAEKRFPGIPTTLADGPQASDMVEAIVACVKSRTSP
ncbi:MAG: uroporphyrinogen-III synthase [Woeseiaceae bacterium]|nr:uroporphyrinogen-III synthase [Woeseiaceae bacterium]